MSLRTFPHRRCGEGCEVLFNRGRFRREAIGPTGTELTLGGSGGTLVVPPHGREALKLTASPGPATSIPGLPVPDAAQIPRLAQRAGTERVDRYVAEVYESRAHYSGPQSGWGPQETITRYWVSRGVPVPVKIEMRVTGPNGWREVQLLQSAAWRIPVTGSLFQLPKGMKVRAAVDVAHLPRPPAALLRRERARAAEREKASRCLTSLHRLAVAALRYAHDHGRLPQAASFAGLFPQIAPYDRRTLPACPQTGRRYLFNTALSGQPLSRLSTPAAAPLFRDAAPHTTDGTLTVAFADGHAERLPPSDPRARGGGFR